MTPPRTQRAPLAGDAAAVGRHYNRHAASEALRLEKYFPVEYVITARYLERHVPESCAVAEIGVGAGHYSELLARRGCRVHLVDVSEKLLEAAAARLRGAGLGERVAGVTLASATELPLPTASQDAVLLLGPLYHLRDPDERRAAVGESARVLKPGGIVAAAGINRLPFLRDMFRPPAEVAEAEEFFAEEFRQAQQRFRSDLLDGRFPREYLACGNLDPEHAPPIGYAHFTTLAEFRELLAPFFQEIAVAGVESFSAPWQERLNAMSADEAAAWLDLIERTGTTPEGLACSDHFLFVGRKKP